MDEEIRTRGFWDLVVVLVGEDARRDVLGEVEAPMAPYDCDVPVDVYRESPADSWRFPRRTR